MTESVAVALIVKNGEQTLGRCLDRLRDAVDEIIVVDTGSTDATKSIARRYTDRIYDFPWRDDFAAARQFAFDQTTADWIVWVDADDVVRHADRIRSQIAEARPDVGGFSWRYQGGWDAGGQPALEFWRERCVRNDGSFRWVGRVHEVLVASNGKELVRRDDVIVEHHPLAGRAGDPGRNRRILEAEYAEHQGKLEPRLLFYLGREYADTGDAPRAIAMLERAVREGHWADERYRAQIQIAELQRGLGDYASALDADLKALAIQPRWPDAYLGLGRTAYFRHDWPNVIHWLDIGRRLPPPDTLLFVNPRDYDFNWIIYYTNALFQLGDTAAALAWTRRALEIVPNARWHRENALLFASMIPAGDLIPIAITAANDLPTYVVIPVRDRHELTLALLGQLDLPPERVIVIDNGSTVPATRALAGKAEVIAHAERNLSTLWNIGLDAAAARCPGPHNVAILNNDLEVGPDFLARLGAGLRVRPDHLIAYPDAEGRLPAGTCRAVGRMTGYAFMLRGEAGLRADPQFVWWFGDDDLERQGRAQGRVVRVGGVAVRHLQPNATTATDPALQAITEQDRERFFAKWG